VLAFVMPAAALNTIVVNQLMVALRLDKKIAQVVLAGAAVSLTSAVILSHSFGGVGMAASRLFSELFIFGFAAFLSWRHMRSGRTAASAAN
jgi:PST family polysaccharide transporter